LLIALVVLLILLFALDRIGLVVAENLLADRVRQSQNLSGKPSVSIGGFPFLTQLVGGDFDNVTVDADGVQRNGLHITSLHVDLGSVRPNSGYSSARVATLNGTAFLNFSDLSTTVAGQTGNQITFSPGSDGKLAASLTLAGQQVSALCTVSVAAGNEIEISAAGTPLTIQIPLGGLPFGLKVTSVAVVSNGVNVTASAQNVVISSSGVSAGD
jgi:hypothetical protein